MKKSKLLALLLAGAMTLTNVPVSVFAEADPTISVTPTEEAAESTEDGTEETPSEGTEESSDEKKEETSVEKEETVDIEGEETTKDEVNSGTTEEKAKTQSADSEVSTEDGHNINTASANDEGDKPKGATDASGIAVYNDTNELKYYFDTLQNAVNYVCANPTESGNPGVIKLSANLELTDTVSVTDGGKVAIKASEDITITRNPAFKADMFAVKGAKSELQFDTEEGKKLTINGTIAKDTSNGSIVSVSESALFGTRSANIILQSNNAPDVNGSAINNVGGTVAILGGKITGNIGKLGAVYTDSDITVSGYTFIGDNHLQDDATLANLYLKEGIKVVVAGELTLNGEDQPTVQITCEKPAEEVVVATRSTDKDAEGKEKCTADQFKTSAGFIKLDDTTNYTTYLDEANSQIKIASNIAPKLTKYTKFNWSSHTTITLSKFTVDQNAKYIYFTVSNESDIKDKVASIKWDNVTDTATKDAEFNIQLSDVADTPGFLVVVAQGVKNKLVSNVLKIDLSKGDIGKKRPPADKKIENVVLTGSENNPNEAWTDHLNLNVGTYKVTKDSTIKVFLVKEGTEENKIKEAAKHASTYTSAKANTEFKVTYTFDDADSEEDYTLIIWAVDSDNTTDYESVSLNRSTSKMMPTRPWAVGGLTTSNITWTDANTITINDFYFDTNVDYYTFWVDPATTVTASYCDSYIAENSDYVKSSAIRNQKFTMTLSDVPADSRSKLVIYGIPKAGGSSKASTISFAEITKDGKNFWSELRPGKDALTFDVSQSIINGLSEPITFWPLSYLKTKENRNAWSRTFEVIGAGTDEYLEETGEGHEDGNPVNGDERWVYRYWSMKADGSEPQYETRIGSKSGIEESKSYDMYIFFEKEVYNAGTGWTKTGTIQSKKVSFTSKAYTNEELLEWMQSIPEEAVNPDYDYSDGVTAADLTQAADKSNAANSSSKTAASTADETPIGALTALAVISILCAGYVYMRKRKYQQ